MGINWSTALIYHKMRSDYVLSNNKTQTLLKHKKVSDPSD